jgi:hypothetical protein
MRKIFILSISLLLLNCGQKTKKETLTTTNPEKTTYNESKIGRQNFAVIWNWTTTDVQLVSDNSEVISKELISLWKKGTVENAYYNSDAKVEKLSYFPNISFFIKAESYKAAELILNKLTVVKKGIAVYQIFPVGNLWLDRKLKAINENGITKSYVAVWQTENKPTDTLTKAQNDKILDLWNLGKIENVYFDIEGTQRANNKIDFVFYVNTNTEKEARTLCESLPFFKKNIATYKLHEVGVFWLGKYKNN